jgi:hypothetical protein
VAVERSNPLPVGSYLWAVFSEAGGPDAMSQAAAWIAKHTKDGTVHVQQESQIVGSGSTYGWWYYFFTSAPVQWDGPGFPDIATPELLEEYNAIPAENPYITAAKDTAGDIADAAADLAPKLGLGLLAAVAVAVAVVVAVKKD